VVLVRDRKKCKKNLVSDRSAAVLKGRRGVKDNPFACERHILGNLTLGIQRPVLSINSRRVLQKKRIKGREHRGCRRQERRGLLLKQRLSKKNEARGDIV